MVTRMEKKRVHVTYQVHELTTAEATKPDLTVRPAVENISEVCTSLLYLYIVNDISQWWLSDQRKVEDVKNEAWTKLTGMLSCAAMRAFPTPHRCYICT